MITKKDMKLALFLAFDKIALSMGKRFHKYFGNTFYAIPFSYAKPRNTQAKQTPCPIFARLYIYSKFFKKP